MAKPGLASPLAIAACLLAGPLAADWLVLEDGTRLETRGSWDQRGKLLVFTNTDGTLVSLRLEEVDLEASQRLTEEAARPPKAKPKAPAAEPKAVLVLTDADVRRGVAVDVEAGDEDEATSVEQERLVVTDWQESSLGDEEGTRITGTLRNVSDDAATRVRLTVLAYEAGGELLAANDAMLSAQSLMPDQQARFQVDFGGVYAIAAVRFRTSTLPLDVGAPEGESEPDESDQGPPDASPPAG
jgi:hypothetical protein